MYYLDMEPKYKPQVYLDGLGQLPTAAYFADVTNLQNKVVLLNSDRVVIGKDVWNTISGQVSERAARGEVPGLTYFPGWEWAEEELLKVINSLTVNIYANKMPTTAQMDLARQRIREFSAMIEFAKASIPATLRNTVEAEAAVVQARLESLGVMKSPAAVGSQAFADELARRAKVVAAIVGTGLSLGLLATVGIGVVLLSQALGGRHESPVRRNPAKQQDSALPLLIGGGVALFLASQSSEKLIPTVSAKATATGPNMVVVAQVPTREMVTAIRDGLMAANIVSIWRPAATSGYEILVASMYAVQVKKILDDLTVSKGTEY